MVLAPFQKQTQVEFTNIKLKEISVRFLTVVNPLNKPGQVNKFVFFFFNILLIISLLIIFLYILFLHI